MHKDYKELSQEKQSVFEEILKFISNVKAISEIKNARDLGFLLVIFLFKYIFYIYRYFNKN